MLLYLAPNRLSEVEENCRLVQFENTKLEQTLSTERERRLEAEDALTVVNERLQLQSYMAARGEVSCFQLSCIVIITRSCFGLSFHEV